MKKLLLILTCLLALPAVEAMAGPVPVADPESQVAASSKEDNLQRLQRELKGKRHCRLIYTTVDKRYALVSVGVMTDKNPAPNPWENKKPSKAVAPFIAFYSVDLESYKSAVLGFIEEYDEEFTQSLLFDSLLFDKFSADNLELSADSYAFSMIYAEGGVLEWAIIGRVDKPNSLVHNGGRSVPRLASNGKTYTHAEVDELVWASDGYAYYPEYEYDFSGNKLGCTYTLCDDPFRPWFGSDIRLPEEVFRGKREAIEAYIESLYGRLSDKLRLKSTGKYSGDALARLGTPNKAIVHLERIEDKGEQDLYLYADGGRVLIKKPKLSQWPLDPKDCLAQNPKGIDILIDFKPEDGTVSEDGTLVIESAKVLYVTGAKDSYREYYKKFYKSLE